MIIAPIIFCTVVHGIASMGDLKKLGRIGIRTLVYFEVVSIRRARHRPGGGECVEAGRGAAHQRRRARSEYRRRLRGDRGTAQGTVDFLLNIIPKTFFDAFASGDILQVLLVSILTAFAIAALGEQGKPVLTCSARRENLLRHHADHRAGRAAGRAWGDELHGRGATASARCGSLLELMAGFYFTSAVFVVFVLGTIAWGAGFSIFRFLNYIKEEIFLVLGTSSSEPALPRHARKNETARLRRSTVGFVIPPATASTSTARTST